MARSVPWRRQCNDLVFWRQTQAQNATIYILRETGPTGFLLKEEGETKPCKAFLGDPHSCTCSQFMKDRDLCKHICWLLLKKFRVPQTDPMSWQKGLVEREINSILRGLTQQMRKKVSTAVTRWRRPLSSDSNAKEVLPQRDIAEDDVCPICQDELLLKRLPVTYCKFGCGNSIHIKCMKIWAEHQKSQGETTVKCPFCREDFGPFEMLKYENRNAGEATQGGRMDRHLGTTCQSCRISPIEGKCYRCSSCTDYHLCQSCFNTPIHTQHGFQYRHKRNQRWRAAGRAYGAVLPQAIVDDLVNRDISENDYDLLMQLDSNSAPVGSNIPEEVIHSFPLEKVRQNGPLLQPGVQCRICLHGYQLGQFVRKLPRCKHKFHRDCIDNWLLHSRPTCPVDGQVVWDSITAQLDDNTQTRARHGQRRRSQPDTVQSNNPVNLEIPGVGLTIRPQEHMDHGAHTRTQVRTKPPPARRAINRESDRVLGTIQNNFSLSGMAVGAAMDESGASGSHPILPGGRLLQRMGNQQAMLEQRLAEGGHQDMNGQENIDPLEAVAVANQTLEVATNTPDPPIYHSLPRPPNHCSIFGQDPRQQQHDPTAVLLQNAERISPMREHPNIFNEEISNRLTVESVRSSDLHSEGQGHHNSSPQGHYINSRSQQMSSLFSDVPPDQRLFVNGNTGTRHQLVRGGNQHSNQGRQLGSTSSAPSNGERGRVPERGRGSERGSVTRNRSNSRDRARESSLERGHYLATGAPVPKEGENLLERLTLFTDLYLGNNPRSQPPINGVSAGNSSLPPHPQRRQLNSHAAAVRQRRFENERRRTNFTLEGNGMNDMTLRDILQ